MKKLKSSIAVLSIVGLCLPSVVIGMPVIAETTVGESEKSTKLSAELDPAETKPLSEWIEDKSLAIYIGEILGVSRTANVSRATLENRKSLIISDEYDQAKIKSMKGLENFKNLTRLSFFGEEVQDYSALNNLHQLTSLSLGHFNGMNLDFVKEMPLLKSLVIYDSPITDISALSSLKNVTHLQVTRAQVKDISVINQMPSLGSAWFDGNQIEEIPTSLNSDQMHNLSLNQNKIKSVEGLKGLDALITLSITDNEVETLAPLRGLIGLQELTAMRNKITTMEGINEMTGLQELNLVRNELMEVLPVTNLTALKKLYVDVNHISNITPWKEMSDAVDWSATRQEFGVPRQKIGIGGPLIIPNTMVDRAGKIISYVGSSNGGMFSPDLTQVTWQNLEGVGRVTYYFRDNSDTYSGVVTVPYEVVAKRTLKFNQATGEELIPSQAILFGDKAIEPTAPTKTGYTFEGWMWDDNGTEKNWDFTTTVMPDQDVTLQATWSANTYQLTYDGNGADSDSIIPSSQSFTVEALVQVVEPTTLVKKGYHFMGWNTEADGTGEDYSVGQTISETKDMTLYVQWESNEYTIQFALNGGDSEIPTAQVLRVGECIAEPAMPTRAGYTFQGWQGSVDGKEIMWDFHQDTVPDQDMTLTAVWKQEDSVPVDPVNPITPVTPNIPITPALPTFPNTPVMPVHPNNPTENTGELTVQHERKQSVEPKTTSQTNVYGGVKQSGLPQTGEPASAPIMIVGGMLVMTGLAHLTSRRRF